MNSGGESSASTSADAALARRDARIAAALLALRSPLARVELAASQLAREASTPSLQDLAARVSHAVADLDARLDESLRALGPESPEAARAEDCRSVLREVYERMAPVLEARGLTTRLRLPEQEVVADPATARRAALALLRAGSGLMPSGGEIELALVAEPGSWSVAIAWPPGGVAPDALEERAAELREGSWRQGGELSLLDAGALLRFRRGPEA